MECCDNFHDSVGDLMHSYVYDLLRALGIVNVSRVISSTSLHELQRSDWRILEEYTS